MPKPFYYLTFRTRHVVRSHPIRDVAYGEQVTVFTDRSPADAYRLLKKAGLAVAYGREGDKPTRDTHPDEAWDTYGEKPSGARK